MFLFKGRSGKAMAELQANYNQIKTWFESAMMMVSAVPGPLMWCDTEQGFKVTFQNDASAAALGQLAEARPQAADEVMGKSVAEVFPELGPGIADRLADPAKLPYRTRLTLGRDIVTFDFRAVSDAEGTYCGAMLCWEIVTANEQLVSHFEDNIKRLVDGMATTTSNLHEGAQRMSQSAGQASRQAESIVDGSVRIGQSVEVMAGASEKLGESLQAVGEQVGQCLQISSAAVGQVQASNAQIDGLTEAAQKIGEVVNLISDIAEQTNLLALNATIEAARAGEAGKGFAVVASEVKSLANQTAKATEDISTQIASIQDATSTTVGTIRGIAETIEQVDRIASDIAGSVEAQRDAIKTLSGNAEEAVSCSSSVAAEVTAANEASGETSETAQRMLNAIDGLAEEAAALTDEVDRFLKDVSAA